jgi:hypothetical protein
MFTIPFRPGRVALIAVGLLVTSLAWGQEITIAPIARFRTPPPDNNAPGTIHKIDLLQGPNLTVRYVPQGNVPTSDRMAAIELERAENELMYAQNLQTLRRQYVNSELSMDPRRLYVQEQLYGVTINYGTFGGGMGTTGWGGGLNGAIGYGYPYAWGGGGWGGWGGGGYGTFGGGYTSSVSRGLQYGMGDEGVFKSAMVQVIASQATPEYATRAQRDYENALVRAEGLPVLARSLSLKKSDVRPAVGMPETYKKGTRLVLTLKGGEKVVGTVEEENAEWIVIRSAAGRVMVRKAEVNRVEEPVMPASGESK